MENMENLDKINNQPNYCVVNYLDIQSRLRKIHNTYNILFSMIIDGEKMIIIENNQLIVFMDNTCQFDVGDHIIFLGSCNYQFPILTITEIICNKQLIMFIERPEKYMNIICTINRINKVDNINGGYLYPNNYTIQLNNTYTNIKYLEMIYIEFDHLNEINFDEGVYLKIKQIKTNFIVGNVKNIVAKITPNIKCNFIIKTPIIFNILLLSLSEMTIKFVNMNGDLIKNIPEHSTTFKISTINKIPCCTQIIESSGVIYT